MSWTDVGISVGLVLLVLRQVRGRELTITSLLWPLGLVLWAALDYLGAIPAKTSDILFTVTLAAVGVALGLGCGLLTRVSREDSKVVVKASPAAAALWIVGMCSRLVFGIVSLHGGAVAIGRLSEKLDLHSGDTWATALITMALCEVLSRTAVLGLQYRRMARSTTFLPTGTTVPAGASPALVPTVGRHVNRPGALTRALSALRPGSR